MRFKIGNKVWNHHIHKAGRIVCHPTRHYVTVMKENGRTSDWSARYICAYRGQKPPAPSEEAAA